MEDLIRSITENVVSLEPGNPTFRDVRYMPVSLDKKHVKKIKSTSSERKIAFVDGGNTCLFSSSCFSVHLIRVYVSLFQGKNRVSSSVVPQRVDCYCFAYSRMKDGEVYYEAVLYPLSDRFRDYFPSEAFGFSSWDESLGSGVFRADINKVCSAVRRFAEWYFAGKVAGLELTEGDLLVRDGTLQTSVGGESTYAEYAYGQAQDNKVLFSGLAKTCTLFTDTGNSLSHVIHDLGDTVVSDDAWFYYPVVTIAHPDHQAELFFVKLHSESKYVFRFELFKENMKNMADESLNAVFADLQRNSVDIGFPGYPYGLVDADRFARVQTWEAEQHKAKLFSLLHEAGYLDDVRSFFSSVDAHDNLWNIGGL